MNSVELIFRYTKEEYVKAEREYLLAARVVHRYDIVLGVIFLLFSIAVLFISSFSALSIVFLGIILLVIVLGGYTYLCMPGVRFKQTAKYQEEYTMIFADEEIRWKTRSVDSNLKWELYSEIWESRDFYFLIQGPRMFALIPKRAFCNAGSRENFAGLVLKHFKEIKHI